MAKNSDAPPIKNNGSNDAAFLQQQQRDAELVAAIQSQKEQQDRALVVQLMQVAAQKEAYLQQQAAMAQAQQRPPIQPTKDDMRFPSYFRDQLFRSKAQPEGSLSAVRELWGNKSIRPREKSAVEILWGLK